MQKVLNAFSGAWDAMTDDRIYRKGFPVEEALAMLEHGIDGGQFDPDLFLFFELTRLYRRTI